MKQIIFLMLILASMVSCNKLDSEEIELMNLSEVLMKETPDSSLVLLKTIRLSDMYSKPAKAQYALLYTKAQHKCYETIVNDSIINIAVEYYKEALNSYKLAEDILEGGEDYELLALIISRMGDLHKMLFSDISVAVERYKSAAYYYNLTSNMKNEGRAYNWIGSRYIFISNKDCATGYL